MVLEPGGIIAWIVVGLIAGWLTGKVVRGGGYGVLRDIILGIVGAFIGRIVMSPFGVQGQVGFMGSIMIAGCLAAYGACARARCPRESCHFVWRKAGDLTVRNMDALAARLKEHHIPWLREPKDEGWGIEAFVTDPGWVSLGDRRAVSPRPLVGLAAESPCGVLNLPLCTFDHSPWPPRSRWTASPNSWARSRARLQGWLCSPQV